MASYYSYYQGRPSGPHCRAGAARGRAGRARAGSPPARGWARGSRAGRTGQPNSRLARCGYYLGLGLPAPPSTAACAARFAARGAGSWQLAISFQVPNDGITFRYVLEGSAASPQQLTAERPTFQLPNGARGWLNPHAKAQTGWAHTQPSYERYYQPGVAAGAPRSWAQASRIRRCFK